MKYFTLSFDDNVIQDRKFVELLNKYSVKCTFNTNSGLFNVVWDLDNINGKSMKHIRIDKSEILNGLYDGHELAAHTVSHTGLLGCPEELVIKEVNDDCENIKELCGETPIGLAYPGGPLYNDETIDILLKHTPIRYARNTYDTYTFNEPENYMAWTPTCWIQHESLFDLAHQFIEADANGDDLLFYVWGHTYEFDAYDNAWERLEEFLKLISGRPDIKYVTNKEFFLLKNPQYN